MNALIEHTIEPVNTQSFELNHFFEELQDPTSMWYDIKVAVLPGSDCLFIPKYIGEAFDKVYPLDEFIENTYRILQTEIQHLVIFCYSASDDEMFDFEQIDVNWSEGQKVIEFQRKTLDNDSPQLDFAKTMFKHCEYLVK